MDDKRFMVMTMTRQYSDDEKRRIHQRAQIMIAQRKDKDAEFAAWRKRHRDEIFKDETDALLTRRAQMKTVIHKISVGENLRHREFVMCTNAKDRAGDIVEPEGLKRKRFRDNPSCFWSHDSSFIIGEWFDDDIRNGQLTGFLKLAPLGISPRVDEIIRLVENNLVRGCSIGFIPETSEPIPGSTGRRYTSGELIEVSLCGTPCNADTLAVARSLHVSDETMSMVFGSDETAMDALADEVGIVTGNLRAEVEALRDELNLLKAKR